MVEGCICGHCLSEDVGTQGVVMDVEEEEDAEDGDDWSCYIEFKCRPGEAMNSENSKDQHSRELGAL